MGQKFSLWHQRSDMSPHDISQIVDIVRKNRQFTLIEKPDYGDHGLELVADLLITAIGENKRIALYADYDVDGTMSCVSWIWFLKAIGYTNFTHYIPCRFNEGYGLNLNAVKYLVEEQKADVIITMDTGITANEEAAYCQERDVLFICTDHHKIQPEKMPDCVILNPKMHPDHLYQELCGCGITFVLLRKLARHLSVPPALWTDLLSLVGMATICDVVPLNGVNHTLARMGVESLLKSKRQVLKQLIAASNSGKEVSERDIGFRLGPRINAVGRLKHASTIIDAFTQENPESLIEMMNVCNDERRQMQSLIVEEALVLATSLRDEPVIFLGGDWHPGVIGIAASKIAETFWKPTWLFQRTAEICKGSARSIPGFDVTDAMSAAADKFIKFGGHKQAGGFTFAPEDEEAIFESLCNYAENLRQEQPQVWQSKISFDCEIAPPLLHLGLVDHLESLRPYGHGFEEPVFSVKGTVQDVIYYNDKVTGEPKHSAVLTQFEGQRPQKIMFFSEQVPRDIVGALTSFLVNIQKNIFRGQSQLSIKGIDWHVTP